MSPAPRAEFINELLTQGTRKIVAKLALTSPPPGLRWGRIADEGDTTSLPCVSWLVLRAEIAFTCSADLQVSTCRPKGRRYKQVFSPPRGRGQRIIMEVRSLAHN